MVCADVKAIGPAGPNSDQCCLSDGAAVSASEDQAADQTVNAYIAQITSVGCANDEQVSQRAKTVHSQDQS